MMAQKAKHIRDDYGLQLHFQRAQLLLRRETDTHEEAVAKSKLNRERRRKHDRLVSKIEDLKDALDMAHFTAARVRDICNALYQDAQTTLDFAISNPPIRPSTEPPEHSTTATIDHELEYVEWRLYDAETHGHTLYNTLRSLTRFLVSYKMLNWKGASLNGIGDVFYRLDDGRSLSVYDSRIGIRCAGWRRGASADFKLSPEHVEDQLRGRKTSPPVISVTDHPFRVLNYSGSRQNSNMSDWKVFIINASKLRAMNVPFKRSTDLVDEFATPTYNFQQRNGVHYSSKSHWLVHRWIPAESIEIIFNFHDFRTFCECIGAPIGKHDTLPATSRF
jgi:hypothetical protein